MNAVQFLWLVFTLVAGCAATDSTPVDCCPEVCDLENEKCTSAGSRVVFSNAVREMDPFCIPSVRREEGQISYSLNNVQVKGLGDCTVKKLKLDTNKSTFEQYLSYPKLTVSYEVETSDYSCSGPITVSVALTICDYEIKNVGNYGVYVSKGDNLPHFYLLNVCTSGKLVGVVEYSVSATCNSCPTTAVGRKLSQILEDVIEIFRKVFEFAIIEVNKILKITSLGEVFPFANSQGSCPST